MSSLKIDSMNLSRNRERIISDFSIELANGEIGCLLGPSGCGKTTILRSIAGFLAPQEGYININGQRVSDSKQITPCENRGVGMVFQDFALFPHLTIGKNIEFGIRHWESKERSNRVQQLLKIIGMLEFINRYPHEISGGQQQRVALIRALAPNPKILLMDEPFSNIDIEFKEKLYGDVLKLLRSEKVTTLLVTHDQNDAFIMADKVGVMKSGRIIQWDTGYNIYHKPNSRFVAEFIGQSTFIKGYILENGLISTELGRFKASLPHAAKLGDEVEVLIRPDDILHQDNSPISAKITSRIFRGASYLYTLELATGEKILSMVNSHHNHKIGEALGITLEIDHCVIFPVRKNEQILYET